MTPVRHAMLSFLASNHTPATLQTIIRADGIRGVCNTTTVYRTLMLFKEADIVRPVGTPHKTSYFMLNVPDDAGHFLICRRCGSIVELPLPEAMVKQIHHIAASRGFVSTRRDFEIHGLCDSCQSARERAVVPSKLAC